ncbi:tetratricopeptide repeat protein [Actinoplanes sp. NPDC026619]|uniref:tetratricopeptide repeat protein n=1 Tax=Actinoplanes sp. NPDC026619 TaxID=3155798 RepID=UPI0033C5729D
MSQPSPLTPARERAQALAAAGDLAAARAILERALELGKANLSEDDPDVLRTAYQLGVVLQKADDPAAARRVLEEAYAAGLRRLGDANDIMLEISHDIGVVAEELGNRHEARKAFSRVAELGPATLGAGHPAVARARAYLGQDQAQNSDVRHGAATQPQSAPPLPSMPSTPTWQPRFTSSVAEPEPAPADEPTTPLHPNADPNPAVHRPNDPTTTFPVINQAAPDDHRTVQPPAPENQQLWNGPSDPAPPVAPRPTSPIEEPTAIHPAIRRRPEPQTPTPLPEQFAPQDLAPQDPAPQDSAPQYFAPQSPGPQYPAPPNSAPPNSGPQNPDQQVEPSYWPAPQFPSQQMPVPQQRFEVEPAIIYPDSAHPGWGQGIPPPYVIEAAPPKRGMGIFAAIAAVLAAVIAVAALVFVLANRSGDDGDKSDVPTLGGSPPTGVQIKDRGSRITVTWQDPAQGSVSFLVAMGHPGEQLKPVTTLGPGQTSYEVSALNPKLDYCFAVVAVYRNNKFATSQQACTARK